MAVSSTVDPLDGISGELADDRYGLKAVLVIFIALACYNVFELVVLVLSTFRHWKGLYFWSLLLSGCLGVVPYSVGFLLKFFSGADSTFSVTILTIGWWTMVTGQAFVLYSRLHLVIRDERMLRRVLYMIIANIFLLHVPTTILTYGSNIFHRNPLFVKGYNIMEKIQMTGFTVQEIIISGLYVWETTRMLHLGSNRENRKIMHQLVGINVSIVIMDLVLLGLEYASYYSVQITLKGVIYSIKLKLEFAVLGKLVDVVQGNRRPHLIGSPIHLPPLQSGHNPGAMSLAVPGGLSFCRTSVINATSKERGGTAHIEVPEDKILAMTEVSTWVERRPKDKITEAA
ncbi:hypothetical protein P175DRAFT_0444984 [Aspergillus ochraceoroseus IBT 24754]|uniref:DUF7703 domain-containing protein n=2 Tax=Aspergillus ochraceoroseus TaxID=138278 RepID=A0A2T5LNL8_9EURO|nr:uncharacterized protein P175DRAFT_0444984 [Aspergillus ochraceoroseus IBT 24754]KKK25001.1 hypothetical protein AOCH_003123 [Aspergillus ochraceoroseus]PTU17880.1 hypothetical protein P175DRAFT_0444984 [Aspergillus ochraceoroseus IBT 24754]